MTQVLTAPRSIGRPSVPPASPESVLACWASILMVHLEGSSTLTESAARHVALGAVRQVISTAVLAGPDLALVDVRGSAAFDALLSFFAPLGAADAVRRTAEATEVVMSAVISAVDRALPDSSRSRSIRAAMAAVLEASSEATVDLVSCMGDPVRSRAETAAVRRAHLVARVLSGANPSREEQDGLLGYDLTTRHIAVVVVPTGEPHGTTMSELALATLHRLGCRRTLVIDSPSGASFGWGAKAEPAGDGLVGHPSAVIAWSGPHADVIGFRDAHREAAATAEYLRDAGRSNVMMDSKSLALVSVLGVDQKRTNDFIRAELGALADAERSHAEWRITLLAYLDSGRSPAQAAERLHVARNTVNYRIARAAELLPGPLSERQLEIHVALRLHGALLLA